VLSLIYIGRTTASIAAIHNLHKSFPLCDIDGNGFFYTEELDFPNRRRILTSNACPNHFNKCQDEECSGLSVTRARQNSVTFDVPLYPVMAEIQTDTTCVNGSVALALNGVSIESMSCKERKCVEPGFSHEARQSIGDKACDIKGVLDGTWICGDAVQLDATKIDKCGGHVDDRGLYHYHIPPVCLIQQLTELQSEQRRLVADESVVTDVVLRSDVKHSVQIGWALDGFPIYGPIGPNGILMKPCRFMTTEESAVTDYCLDECNGLYGAFEGVDDYMYRYYISGEMGSGECSEEVENGGACARVTEKCCIDKVPSVDYQPYTIGCFKGCRHGDESCVVSSTAAVTDTYYPALSLHPADVYEGVTMTESTSVDNSESDTSDGDIVSDEVVDVIGNLVDGMMYGGYGRTAVRLHNRKLGLLSKIKNDDNIINPAVVVEELVQSDEDAYITGLTLGYRGDSEATSQLLFTTQRGLWVIQEDGQDGKKFVSGYKTVLVKGYNLGSSLSDIKLLTVKGQNCSYAEVIDSQNVFCIMSTLDDNDVVEDNDVVINTVAGNNIGIHIQPLTVALSASKRAVVAEIVTTHYPMTPYAVAYPFTVPVSSSEAASEAFVYWSDLTSHRIYRSTVSGDNLEIVMESVYNVYSLLLMDIATAQGVDQSSEEKLDQFLFYTDANRGILGRVSVSSGSRLDNGPYMGDQHSVQNMGSENDQTNIILLKGLSEPRGISAQIERGYFYFTTHDGYAYEAPLSHFTSTSDTPMTPVDVSVNPPTWLKKLIRAKTNSRFDGIGTLPLASPAALSSNTVKSWNEQYIFIPDTTTNSLIVLNDDSFALSVLNMNEGFGSSGVVWPRSIATRRPYASDTSSTANNTAVVYIGEMLGKIWRVTLDFTSVNGRRISLSGLKRPELVADYSKFSSSIRLRQLVNEKKFIDDRNNLVFPELLN